jgi:activating signal cointegrator 1
MRAISLWQPWASYIAVGMKRFETRSWSTSHRGRLAIHAAKRPLGYGERELLAEYPMPIGTRIPLGEVVAICNLVDCWEMRRGEPPTDLEDALGDWYQGRFAWELANVEALAAPLVVRGAQGLWEWKEPE